MNGYQQFFKARKEAHKKKSKFMPSSPIKKQNKKWNVGPVLGATVLFVGGVYYLVASEDQLSKLYNKVDVSIFGAAQAQDAAKSAASAPKTEEKKSSGSDPEVQGPKGEKRAWTDEEVALFTKLEERKKQLDAREASLNKLEEELQKQRDELEKRLAALEDVRGKIAAKLETKVKTDGEKVTTLVSVYSNMKPAQAAKIIEGLDDDLAIEVLTKMKNKNAAEILNLMDPEKAKHFSEKYAGFKEALN